MLGGHVAAADRPLIQLTYTNDELLAGEMITRRRCDDHDNGVNDCHRATLAAGLELASVKKVAFPCDDVRDYSKVGSVTEINARHPGASSLADFWVLMMVLR